MFLLFFQNILLGKLSECQIVWIQIKTNKMSVLIRIQTVCNSFRQTTKIAASKERVNSGNKTIPVWFLKVLIDFSLTVKAATLVFKPGRGSAISSRKQGKSGTIYNLVKN